MPRPFRSWRRGDPCRSRFAGETRPRKDGPDSCLREPGSGPVVEHLAAYPLCGEGHGGSANQYGATPLVLNTSKVGPTPRELARSAATPLGQLTSTFIPLEGTPGPIVCRIALPSFLPRPIAPSRECG
jgi:hypothetical protein